MCEKLFQRGWGSAGQLCTCVLLSAAVTWCPVPLCCLHCPSLLVHQEFILAVRFMPRSSQGSAWWLTDTSVLLGGRRTQYS